MAQAADAERGVQQRELPPALLQGLRDLVDAWRTAPTARAHALNRFQELDFDQSGWVAHGGKGAGRAWLSCSGVVCFRARVRVEWGVGLIGV